jgi:sigma-B regulation protein RsbU (phosphoserine phosphatase)
LAMQGKKEQTNRLRISKFKLESLLDITLSINANLPVEDLLSKYEYILRYSLGIGKILIFKRSGAWECILNCDFPKHFETIDVESRLSGITEIAFGPFALGFEGVDIIVPVYNNKLQLAFVFIGDFDEEGAGMSPILKHLNFIQTISSIIIVAIENIRLFNESLRQEALKKELELAAKMQKMLIPDNIQMPKNTRLKVTGFYYPHYEVGGDYYDCIRLSETKTGFCIADVSGKGISAAMLMSNFQASLRALFTHDINLESLIRKLNSIVIVNAEGEKFITIFIARFDHDSGILEYINAAHIPPVLYNTVTKEIRHLQTSCPGIGMLDELPRVRKTELLISDNSKIVCYTDGLSELKGEDGHDIGTKVIIRHISNNEPVENNIREMIKELGLPDNNPSTFDDVSILALDLIT